MRTMESVYAIGQRFAQRLPDAVERMWSITKIEPPEMRFAPNRIVLTAERNGATMLRFAPVLSQELMDGVMRWDGEPEPPSAPKGHSPTDVAFGDLIALMTRVQLRKFKTRCAYASVMLQAEGVGLSWKDKSFCALVDETFLDRQTAWLEGVKANPEEPSVPIEAKAPSCFSVDRWFRAVRKNQGDLSILAVEVLATQTRAYRRPEERRLLEAFLASKQARRVKYTASSLTREFGRLVKKTDPLRLDEVIDELRKKAELVARQNKERSAKRPLKRRKPMAAPKTQRPAEA